MVLAQKQKWSPMEQDREPRQDRETNAPMGTLFLAKNARTYNGANTAPPISGAGKTGQLHAKE